MTYITNRRIDMVYVNEDGTVEIIDSSDACSEYPFTWQYKLYYSFEENEKIFLSMLYHDPDSHYATSPRFQKFLENRKSLYDEARHLYFPMIYLIENSNLSTITKKAIINKIDLELNQKYPYHL